MVSRNTWDFRRILIILTRQWWVPISMLLLSFLAARLYLRYATATYKSDATIQLDFGQSSFVKTDKSGASFLPIESMTDAYIELFSTYDLIETIVRELRLDWETYSVGKVGRSLIFPNPFQIQTSDSLRVMGRDFNAIFPVSLEVERTSQTFTLYKGDSVICSGKIGQWATCGTGKLRIAPVKEGAPLPNGEFLIFRYSERQAVQSWQTRISALPKRGLTTWVISVTDVSPVRAQAFLSKLLEHAREYERSLRQVQYKKAIEYVDTLLHAVRINLTQAQDSLFAKERAFEMPFAEARRQRTVSLFSEVEEKRLEVSQDAALATLARVLQKVADSLSNNPGTNIAPILIPLSAKEDIRQPLQEINELIARRERLMQLYTPSAAPVASLNQTLLRRLAQAQYLVAELRASANEANLRRLQEWLRQRERLYKDISSEREFSLLEEDIALRRDIYKSLLEKKIQLSIDKEAVASAIRVSQPPTAPNFPLSPNPIQVYIVALVLGFVLGVGSVLGWHFIHQRVSYRMDIEGLSPVPIIGELPYGKGEKGLFPFSGLQLEVLRSLRSAIGFLWEEGYPKVLVLNSTVSGEGKSYVARGMAYAYALSGYKVLLIDADLRRASISHQVGFREQGLSLLLSAPNQAAQKLAECIIPMGREGLDLLPSGTLPPNPAELLETGGLEGLIQVLADRYDIFIIDTAPIGLVPDALGILRHLPHAVVLYVFRADYSRIPFLSHLEEAMKVHRLNKVYLLFNGTRLSKPRYGYGYGYGYYGDTYGGRYYRTSQNGKLSVWRRIREFIPI